MIWNALHRTCTAFRRSLCAAHADCREAAVAREVVARYNERQRRWRILLLLLLQRPRKQATGHHVLGSQAVQVPQLLGCCRAVAQQFKAKALASLHTHTRQEQGQGQGVHLLANCKSIAEGLRVGCLQAPSGVEIAVQRPHAPQPHAQLTTSNASSARLSSASGVKLVTSVDVV